MKEKVYDVYYKDASLRYRVEKETTPVETCFTIYRKNGNNPEVEYSRYSYPSNIEGYDSPFLSWYNLFFCSGVCGPEPDYEYMTNAVQQGKKTAGTVYVDSRSAEGQHIMRTVPKNCSALRYGQILYVFHKGCLSDYFDFETIRRIYDTHCRQFINWDIVKDYFDKPLSYFGDEEKCGFHLHCGDNKEQRIILGLLLGYPVESTIDYMNKRALLS